MKKTLGDWGTYSDERCIEYGARFLFTVKFTDELGISAHKFFISVRRNQTDKLYLWRHKNPRARRFDRKYYQSRDEILDYLNSNECTEQDLKK